MLHSKSTRSQGLSSLLFIVYFLWLIGQSLVNGTEWQKKSEATSWCTVSGRDLLAKHIPLLECQKLCEEKPGCTAIEYWENIGNQYCYECTDPSKTTAYTNQRDSAYPVYVWLLIIDGSWSQWSAWSPCSTTCDSAGTQTRTRTCNNPAPAHGGADCDGQPSETQTCAGEPCPGSNPPDPTGSVTCNDGHTADITITNVDDLDKWTEAEWQLESSPSCKPTFDLGKLSYSGTVSYRALSLPDCSKTSEKLQDGSIKYTLEISPTVTDQLQSRSYSHLFTVTCTYDTEDRVVASFVPIMSRSDTGDETASFTFSLNVYPKSDHTGTVPNPVALDQTLYFKTSVTTASSTPNLDLYPSACWASKSNNADSTDGKITLISKGCGHSSVSEDLSDTLSYTCASDSTEETFSISSFRYVGASDGDSVYFHCDVKVCLADAVNSACDCPTNCGGEMQRKRRSYKELIYETEVYHVTAGPFIFKDDKKDNKELDKDKGEHGQQDERQSFLDNMTVVVAVSGVVIVGIVCACILFIVRNRSRQATRVDEHTVPITSPLESPLI